MCFILFIQYAEFSLSPNLLIWLTFVFSAGVGRTGTLVALDSLIQQLNDEKHVAIFNTVCDLRHQRNFLVQSLVSFSCFLVLVF